MFLVSHYYHSSLAFRGHKKMFYLELFNIFLGELKTSYKLPTVTQTKTLFT